MKNFILIAILFWTISVGVNAQTNGNALFTFKEWRMPSVDTTFKVTATPTWASIQVDQWTEDYIILTVEDAGNVYAQRISTGERVCLYFPEMARTAYPFIRPGEAVTIVSIPLDIEQKAWPRVISRAYRCGE